MAETAVVPPTEFETQVGVPDIRNRMAELLGQPGLSLRQCYHNLQTGIWPGVHRGGKWTLRPHRVLEEMRREEDAALAARKTRLAGLAAAKAAGNGGPHTPEAPHPKRRRDRPRRELEPEGRVPETSDG
jgi:hypothetical protein